jgi:hypothetical protein
LAEPPQKTLTRKMETVDRGCLRLPRIKPPKPSFQATFMKAMEEK